MKLTVVGCSPAWPNPGGAQSGYLLEGPGRVLLDCGPGVLARLRANGQNGWPQVEAIAITHFHLDHWGDLVPWVWGRMWGLGREYEKPDLWLPPGGREELAAFGTRFGTPDMFVRVFEPKEYAEGEPFEAAGLELTALRLPHYTVQTYGFRVSNSDRTLAYSGDSGPSERLARLAEGVDLFLCEATLSQPEHGIRGHLTADEALDAFASSGAKRFVVIHRPDELPLPEGVERACDGMELDV
jgi:ribonuclease BN (tRNA processing enzyme)